MFFHEIKFLQIIIENSNKVCMHYFKYKHLVLGISLKALSVYVKHLHIFKCVILLIADEGTNLLVLGHGGEVLQYDPLLHGQVQGHQAVRPNHVALHLRPATVAALI